MADRKWTAARLRGLEAFVRGGGSARESNATNLEPTHGFMHVYWQTRAWLDREGLIYPSSPPVYRLTPAGWDAAREHFGTLLAERVG